MKRVWIFIILLTLICFFNTACQKNKLAENQELTVAVTADPVTLDPQRTKQNTAYTIITNVMEGLVRINDEGEIEPALAKSWQVSEDKLTYTFALKDALWSDNTPITAYDIEYSLKRALDSSFPSEAMYQMYIIQNAYEAKYGTSEKGEEVKITSKDIGITAIDDKTLEIKLKEPTSYFVALLANPVFIPSQKESIDAAGDDYATASDLMVYSGPYIVKEWIKDKKIILVKNPDYWDSDNVILNKIEFIIEPQSAEIVKSFQQGETDLFEIPSSYIAQFTEQQTCTQVISATTWYIQFNCSNKYFSNTKIRQAFAMAIDKDDFLSRIKNGTALKTDTLTAPSIPLDGEYLFAGGKSTLEPIIFNKEKANQLLEEGLEEIGLTREEFAKELLFLAGEGDVWDNVISFISNQIKNVFDIDLKVDTVGAAELIKLYQNKEYAFTYCGSESDFFDPISNLEEFLSNNPNNFSYFSNTDYDGAVTEAKESEKNKRTSIIQAERILAQEVPIIPLYHAIYNFAVQSDVKGVLFIPIQMHIDFKKTYITK